MKFFVYISVLILFGCSHPATSSDTQDVILTSENLILFLRDNDHFDIYCESDTLSFYLELNNEEYNEYTYDIYRMNDKVKGGKFVFGANFEDSYALNLYFDCTLISFPKEVCNKWVNFVKDPQSNLYYENMAEDH